MLAKWVIEDTKEWEVLTKNGWVPLPKTRRWAQNEFYCAILCKEDSEDADAEFARLSDEWGGSKKL